MRTLKQFWAFANDETTLSDAEIVARGKDRWSEEASQSLHLAANQIVGRAWQDGNMFMCECPITWALENHPLAFRDLSMWMLTGLNAMREVVPEAKREEPAKPEPYEYSIEFHTDKPVRMMLGTTTGAEDTVLYDSAAEQMVEAKPEPYEFRVSKYEWFKTNQGTK